MGLTVLAPGAETFATTVKSDEVSLDKSTTDAYTEKTLALSPITEESVDITYAIQPRASRVTLGSYTLSKAQTKSLASSMKTASGGAQLNAVVVILGPVFGAGAAAYSAATILSRNAVFKKEVISAANQGKRVKVTITDGVPHTSYSTQVTYKVVK